MEVETIKRQTGAAYDVLVRGQSVGTDLAAVCRLYDNSVCDINVPLRYVAFGAI